MNTCRICQSPLRGVLDLGKQPLSDAFIDAEQVGHEYFYHLSVVACTGCAMVQLGQEVPREKMFHDAYPYRASGSEVMRRHFEETARSLIDRGGDDPFIVELGCNDGVMLETVAKAGVRHLGVDPSANVAEMARERGIDVRVDFFEDAVAAEIRAEHGPASVVYAANTLCHIPYLDSIMKGLDALLSPDGVFVFEDPYLGAIVEKTSFDQIYDEHFYFFSGLSVRNLAQRHGFELIDVLRLPVHGGEVRYTLGRAGHHQVSDRVRELLEWEAQQELHEPTTLDSFARRVEANRDALVAMLEELRDRGLRVAGYGATAKSATVNNFCGIGPELVDAVYDTTPEKQGRLTPGSHIPVRPMAEFTEPYPDVTVLYAWNHAEEIMAKETAYREAGGTWLVYVPEPRLL